MNTCIERNGYNMVVILSVCSIIFAILSSPNVYKFTGSKTRKYDITTSDENGCPYAAGILLHSMLFTISMIICLSNNALCITTMTALLILIVVVA